MDKEPGRVAGPHEHAGDGNVAPSSSATDEIRAQIEHTRAAMTQTIDAIQAHLSPSRVVSDATRKVKDTAASRMRKMAGAKTDLSTTHLMIAAVGGVAAAAIAVQAWRASRSAAGSKTDRSRRVPPLLIGACAGFACTRAWLDHA
jgi:hypothetical protein